MATDDEDTQSNRDSNPVSVARIPSTCEGWGLTHKQLIAIVDELGDHEDETVRLALHRAIQKTSSRSSVEVRLIESLLWFAGELAAGKGNLDWHVMRFCFELENFWLLPAPEELLRKVLNGPAKRAKRGRPRTLSPGAEAHRSNAALVHDLLISLGITRSNEEATRKLVEATKARLKAYASGNSERVT